MNGITRLNSTFVHRIDSYNSSARYYRTVCGLSIKGGGEIRLIENFNPAFYTFCGFCKRGEMR